ncbi:hypothetical protein SCUP234_04514 [Seiridium cupressi]
MASYKPSSEVGHLSMKMYYPEWTAYNTARHQAVTGTEHRGLQDEEYAEFVLSSNWIMLPAGLEAFYRQLGEIIKNPEITYDIDIGCFRVRCRRDEQHDIVIACNDIMAEIVKDVTKDRSKEEPLISFDTGESDLVRYISEWRLVPLQEAERHSYEVFSFPRDIVDFPFRGAWKVPEDDVREGLTIRKLFLGHDPVKSMTNSTGCLVTSGTDGRTLYFGANSSEQISQAKRKMANILKYHRLDSRVGSHEIVIFAEDDSARIVDLRYVAHTDRRYLRNVVLDPTKFQPDIDYAKLYEKGSFLRSTRRQQGDLVPAAAELSPAIQLEEVAQSFAPFKTWKVKEKDQVWDAVSPAPSQPETLAVLDDDRLEQVDPQRAPHVLEWAAALPPFESMSITAKRESSNSVRPMSLLDLPAQAPLPTDGVLIALDGSPEKSLGPRQGDTLRTGTAHGQSGNHYSAPNYRSRSSMASSPRTSSADIQSLERPKEALGHASAAHIGPQGASDEFFGGQFTPRAAQENGSQQEPADPLSSSLRRPASTVHPTVPTSTLANEKQGSSRSSKTNNQKAPPFPGARERMMSRGLDSGTREKIQQHLIGMLEPLRFHQGLVYMRVEIGRFWFTKINWRQITLPGVQGRSNAGVKTVEAMEESLKGHCIAKDFYFTKILSLFGGDANHFGNIPYTDASKMWLKGTRRAVYEFWCATKSDSGGKTYFILQIDALTFAYTLRRADSTESDVYVHCSKRDFDFRVVVGASSDIEDNCGRFAREVVASLKVIPQDEEGSSPPRLEFINFRDWGVEIKSVRYRQLAAFKHHDNRCELHVTHVHCMKKKTTKKSDSVWYLSAYPDLGKPDAGYFPTWFEAYITPTKADQEFAQNRELVFAEETTWTSESLKDAGTIDDMLDCAAATVKHMDGIGYWVDNQQDHKQYSEPPRSRDEVVERAAAPGPEHSYW